MMIHPVRRRALALFYIIAFLFVSSLPLMASIAGFQTPNLEKRTLAKPPSLMVEGELNLHFTMDFENYFADGFAFRSYLVSGYHLLNQMLLGRSGNDKVIAGEEGWLYFTETLPNYLAWPVMEDAQYRRLAKVLTLQKEYLASQGIRFHFAIAPNKSSIHGDKMPDRYVPVQESNDLERWLASPSVSSTGSIDLLDALRKAAEESKTPLYHRTDSHWNNLGARIAFQTLMKAMAADSPGFMYDDYGQASYSVRKDWQGDLAVMLYPSGVWPEEQQYFDVPQRYRTTVPMRSLEDLVIATTKSKSAGEVASSEPLRLLMFRDSFANALIPMLANTFDSVVFTRELPYDYTKVDLEDFDVVLLEIVERNMENLLDRAPVMPALERTPEQLPEGGSGLSNAQVVTIETEKHGSLLRISCRLADVPEAVDEVESICIGLRDDAGQLRLYEAFPIDGTTRGNEEDAPVTGSKTFGLTAYLPEGAWSVGEQEVRVWLQTGDLWQHLDVGVVLP